MGKEVGQQVELQRGELQLALATKRLPGKRIEHEIGELQPAGGVGQPAAKDSGQPGGIVGQLVGELVLGAGGRVLGQVGQAGEPEGVLLVDASAHQEPGRGDLTLGVAAVEGLIEARALCGLRVEPALGDQVIDGLVAVG